MERPKMYLTNHTGHIHITPYLGTGYYTLGGGAHTHTCIPISQMKQFQEIRYMLACNQHTPGLKAGGVQHLEQPAFCAHALLYVYQLAYRILHIHYISFQIIICRTLKIKKYLFEDKLT